MSLVDNRTQLQDSEAHADVAADSDGDPQATTTEAGLLIEGSGALSLQITNANEYIAYDQDSASSTFNLDLSDSTVYVNMKDNQQDTFANLGGLIVLCDGADGGGGDCIGYTAGGSDAGGLFYQKRYNAYKLDVSEPVATPGTNNVDYFIYNGTEAGLNHTAILQVGYGAAHLVKAVGTTANTWLDGIYYIANDSYAATIAAGTVSTPETMTDVVVDDEAVGAAMFSNPKGTEFDFFAPTEWGTPSGTADSYFTATDEQWYWLGDNGGGRPLGATHFPFRIIGNSTGTNSWVITRTTMVNTGIPAELDLSNADMDFVKLDTCTLINVGAITMPTQVASDKFCDDTTFINCAQIDLQNLDMDACAFIGTTDANGAIKWDETVADSANQDNLTFTSDGTGHAIEVLPVGAGAPGFTYNIDGYTVSGYEAADDTGTGNTVFICDHATDENITINVTNGSGTFSYERAAGYTGTVAVVQSVTVTFEAVDKDDAAIASVRVTAYLVSDDSEVINTTTNGSGIASTTFSGSTPADLYYRYRKSSTGATKYENLSGFGTIAASTGISVKRSMTADAVADPSI